MKFEQLYDWSLVPEKHKFDSNNELLTKKVYEENFRWLRNDRTPALCPSYRKAFELGWIVRSPVDIVLCPIQEIQLANSEDKAEIMSLCNFDSIWTRDSNAFGIRTDMNFAAYEFNDAGKWESMFIVNGHSSLEWRLGFKCVPDKEESILVIEEFGTQPIGIIPGLLSMKHVTSKTGMSVAIKPLEQRKISRGDIIARLIPVANAL
ncbi:hypothetical protein [Thalassomonas sp. RHCl1]|uniref:hypothetical protein n=1 Tax=Thalassomonas sp. RHCl1 TaxID=2995320 RepID=UPI00248B2E47|nr:hypothetical protein [Thalassomonas sp. RHCl1]